jgi:ammonium transporter, Amt family
MRSLTAVSQQYMNESSSLNALNDLQQLRQMADLLWLVIAGALVFFMQAGFAFLESGMSRAKNTVNVIMKNYCDMCFGALVFWLLGYGLMFGDNPTGWLGMSAFAMHQDSPLGYGQLFFQMMFAATSATIVSGAIAERARFSSYIVGSMVITGIIYPVYGAWAWGSSGDSQGWLRAMGFIDFAGSSVVHSVGGWAALAALIVVGPRLGRFGPDGQAREILGHNLPMVSMGAFILWLGWFGFNAGSTGGLSMDIGKIALNTHLGGACGALGGILTLRLFRRKVMLTITLNASIAGLVGVTAGCQVMEPAYAALAGAIAGGLSVIAAQAIEAMGIDDVVGAVSVHAVGGLWGTLAAGLFNQANLFDPAQLGVQALGAVAACVWGFGASFAAFKLIDRVVPLRASTLDEQRGLDYTEHYELGYPEFQEAGLNRGKAS